MRQILIKALRVYVAMFALFVGAVAVMSIIDPSFAQSEPPYPTRAEVFPRALGHAVVGAAALAASLRLRMRKANSLLPLVLIAGGICFAYDMLIFLVRMSPLLAALATGLVVFLFYLGPLCGALWLWFRARGPRNSSAIYGAR